MKNLQFLIFVAALALSGAAGCAKGEPVARAEAAFKEGKYQDALVLAQPEAEKGNPKAQVLLGLAFSQAKGAPEDFPTAVAWFRKAAEQGYPAGQFDLGFMYENGVGVEEDPIEAHKWYSLASAAGDKDAAKNLAALEPTMSKKQIAAAKKRATQFHVKTKQ